MRRYFIFIIILLAALIALLFAYFILTKPPVSKSAKKQDDFRHIVSIYGFEGDLLRRPTGVAVDSQGRIFVADTGKHRIVVFDRNGNFVNQFGDPGEGQYNIKNPIAVAVAPDNRVYILSKTLKKIVIYNGQLQPMKEVKFEEWPLSLTIHNKMLYVTTYGGIMIGDLEGNLITAFGKFGMAPGEFRLPGGITVGNNGNIYIADSLNYRVQALNKDGEPLWQYGKPIPPDNPIRYRDKDRKFGMPASVALDDNGHLYVVDGLSSEIVILDTKGKLIDTIGDVGHDDGFFYYPAGIMYAGQGRLVLADKLNDRVQVFQVPFAMPASAKLFAWAPYLLLLLLPLLLWLLMRPRLRIVASEDFLQAALSDDAAENLSQAFKKLLVVPQTFENLKAQLPEKLKLVQQPVSDAEVEGISSHAGLSRVQRAALALANNIKGKKVLLTDSTVVKDAAEDLELTTMTYNEFQEAYSTQTTGKDK